MVKYPWAHPQYQKITSDYNKELRPGQEPGRIRIHSWRGGRRAGESGDVLVTKRMFKAAWSQQSQRLGFGSLRVTGVLLDTNSPGFRDRRQTAENRMDIRKCVCRLRQC